MDSLAERSSAYNDIMADGIVMSIVSMTLGTFTPSTGIVTNVETTYDTYGIFTDYKMFDVDGTIIKLGDKKVVLAITNDLPELKTDDKLSVNGVIWSIISIIPISPNDIPIIYLLQVRK